MSSLLLEINDLVKDYQALRPLRIKSLTLVPGDLLAISGLDAVAAETFVHLVTGATLPDSGDIALFGHNTKTITDGEAWLKSLDGVGMVTARGIVIEMFTVLQNIAMLRDRGKCVLFSTHIMREVEKLCDRVAIMHRGRILASGTPAELREAYRQPDLEEIFFSLVGGE